MRSASLFRLPEGFVALRPDFGLLIGHARREQCVTQQALADTVGIARKSLSLIECGHSLPRPDTVDALLRELSLDWPDIAIRGESLGPTRHFDGSWRGDLRRELGGALRRQRLREGLTLRDVAARTGVSVAQLSRIERGEGSRSSIYEDHPDDVLEPQEYRRVRFSNSLLVRLATDGSD